VPEGQNELKRQQLRELASLNGTLRDDENQICANCGATGHRKWECPDQENFTVNLVCKICQGKGHSARDCMERNNPEAIEKMKEREVVLDEEYLNLMAELGEGNAPPPTASSGAAAPLPPTSVDPMKAGWQQPTPYGAPRAYGAAGMAGSAPPPTQTWQAGQPPPPMGTL
jgi:splicing factor 1